MKRPYFNGAQRVWTAGTTQDHSDGSGIHQYLQVIGDVDGDGPDDLVFISATGAPASSTSG